MRIFDRNVICQRVHDDKKTDAYGWVSQVFEDHPTQHLLHRLRRSWLRNRVSILMAQSHRGS